MSIHAQNKALIAQFWERLDAPALDTSTQELFADQAPYNAMEPIGTITGGQAFMDLLWAPLRSSLSEFRRETHMMLAGRSYAQEDANICEGDWVGSTGYFHGLHSAEFLGIPAANQQVKIRWGEFLKIENGQIVDAQFQLDLIDWCDQIGTPLLPKSRGAPFVYPAPTGEDGAKIKSDEIETAKTLQLGRDLIYGGLNTFDEENLASMGMAQYFHPNLKWYGPGGINACLSFKEFEDLHQAPWLVAFPDRKVANLESLFAEGPFVAGSGIAGVVAKHSGPYLGHAPKGGTLNISGLDFWLRKDDQFIENWVFVDMIKLFREMGYDLLGQVR